LGIFYSALHYLKPLNQVKLNQTAEAEEELA